MKYSNTTLHRFYDSLNQCLECNGLLGYAIAVNVRKISTEIQEYEQCYIKALEQYGTVSDITAPDGTIQKKLFIEPDSENIMEFEKALEPIAYIEHDVNFMKVPYSEAYTQLNAAQMIMLDFMLEESCVQESAHEINGKVLHTASLKGE